MAQYLDVSAITSGAMEGKIMPDHFNDFLSQIFDRLNMDQKALIKLLQDNGYTLHLYSFETTEGTISVRPTATAVITFEHNYIHSEITLRF